MSTAKHNNHPNHHSHFKEGKISRECANHQANSIQQDQPVKDNHNTFKLPFFIILSFAFVELFGGIWSQSLALLSDAWHMFSDVLALGLAWLASYLSLKPNIVKNANGQSKVEMIAAIFNATLMLVIVAYIIAEALQRFNNPQPINSLTVILIAFVGLIVNLIVAKLLHSADINHSHDHNKRAAYLHVLGDLLGSVAALASGVVIYFTGWLQIDPLLSIFISLLILGFTIKLIRDAWLSYKFG